MKLTVATVNVGISSRFDASWFTSCLRLYSPYPNRNGVRLYMKSNGSMGHSFLSSLPTVYSAVMTKVMSMMNGACHRFTNVHSRTLPSGTGLLILPAIHRAASSMAYR